MRRSAGQNQTLLDRHTVRAGPSTAAGTYTGTITITAAQGNATIPVTLTVWNFELPAQPSNFPSGRSGLPPRPYDNHFGQALMRTNLVWCCRDASSDVKISASIVWLAASTLSDSVRGPITTSLGQSNPQGGCNFPAGLQLDLYVRTNEWRPGAYTPQDNGHHTPIG